ncbi:MAG TPA: IS200/IS605 family transposase [Anaerolineae bacterium]|nr:IS200/IS605 family transposase [Anaerolineae bacterium]HQH39193.1 IS200/IS605 family transposase [Anaerolineae bacterium]
MPYWHLFYHFTWATTGRVLSIDPAWESELHRVITAKAQALGAIVYAVGGIEDHIHLVASVPPKLSLSEFVGQVKGNSAHFVNHVKTPDAHFAWQKSYGVVSFGEKNLEMVIQYVKRQREHHSGSSTILFLERVESDDLETKEGPELKEGRGLKPYG